MEVFLIDFFLHSFMETFVGILLDMGASAIIISKAMKMVKMSEDKEENSLNNVRFYRLKWHEKRIYSSSRMQSVIMLQRFVCPFAIHPSMGSSLINICRGEKPVQPTKRKQNYTVTHSLRNIHMSLNCYISMRP